MEREIICYDKTFDYEDMKIAIIVSQYCEKYECLQAIYETYEDLINLCTEIKTKWLELSKDKALCDEDYAYIQCFAESYILENFEL